MRPFWGQVPLKAVVPQMPSVFRLYFKCGGNTHWELSVFAWLWVCLLECGCAYRSVGVVAPDECDSAVSCISSPRCEQEPGKSSLNFLILVQQELAGIRKGRHVPQCQFEVFVYIWQPDHHCIRVMYDNPYPFQIFPGWGEGRESGT